MAIIRALQFLVIYINLGKTGKRLPIRQRALTSRDNTVQYERCNSSKKLASSSILPILQYAEAVFEVLSIALA